MQPIGMAFAGPAFPPPPVRAGSHLSGTIEHKFWEPTPPAWGKVVMQAARALAQQWRRERRAGRGAPDLGRVALDVLGALCGLVDHATGRLEPSYETLADQAGASRSGVAAALRELRDAGLLAWARRHEPTGEEAGPGVVCIRQVSNCYAMRLPLVAERALGQVGEVRAAHAARRRAQAVMERAEREHRAAEQRAVLAAQRAEMEAARERGASKAPWTPSPTPMQSDQDAFAQVIARAMRLLADPPDGKSRN